MKHELEKHEYRRLPTPVLRVLLVLPVLGCTRFAGSAVLASAKPWHRIALAVTSSNYGLR